MIKSGFQKISKICFICVKVFLISGPLVQAANLEKPNIIVILADDMGYGDVEFNGCKDIPTPNIQSLAAQGTRFSNGYSNHAYCSPTRAAIMAGRYQHRFGHEFNVTAKGQGMPTNLITLPQALKTVGYATGIMGKWHLGDDGGRQPHERGFDEFYGFLGGSHSYLPGVGKIKDRIQRNGEHVPQEGYLTEVLAREAISFIQKHSDQPFFLYLSFNAVHMPLQATDKYLERFKNIEDKSRRTYAAMTSAMDDAIGQVIEVLKKTDLEKRTVIFFLSDNGGPPENASSNKPLRGHKAQLYEGGIHVPFIVQWRGKIPEGKVLEQLVISHDIYATSVFLAGAKMPEDDIHDGANLMPLLLGESDKPVHEALFWRMAGDSGAIRFDEWKLILGKKSGLELYNLKSDLEEKINLTAQKPEITKKLNLAWDEWNKKNVPPLWIGSRKLPDKE